MINGKITLDLKFIQVNIFGRLLVVLMKGHLRSSDRTVGVHLAKKAQHIKIMSLH